MSGTTTQALINSGVCPLGRDGLELLALDHGSPTPTPGRDEVQLQARPRYGGPEQDFYVSTDVVIRAISAAAQASAKGESTANMLITSAGLAPGSTERAMASAVTSRSNTRPAARASSLPDGRRSMSTAAGEAKAIIDWLDEQPTGMLTADRMGCFVQGLSAGLGLSGQQLVAGQALQAGAVSDPEDLAEHGVTEFPVEIYALGAGVTIDREGSDLPAREGAFEIKAMGVRFVFDPLAATHTEWAVTAIEGEVTAVNQALQTESQEDKLEVKDALDGHDEYFEFKTVILTLAAGTGKTTIGPVLAKRLGCTAIVDMWHPASGVMPGALHLTNADLSLDEVPF